MNADRSYIASSSSVACGGILRSHDRKFFTMWIVNLGCCSINSAKLWGAYWGLFSALRMGYKNVFLQLNSSYGCHMIFQGVVDSHVHAPLINVVRILIGKFDGEI